MKKFVLPAVVCQRRREQLIRRNSEFRFNVLTLHQAQSPSLRRHELNC
jgi:hypothetical protein